MKLFSLSLLFILFSHVHSAGLCDDAPCNGGSCTDTSPTSYTCDCLPGYTGDQCEGCPLGLGGQNCDHDIDECEFNDANTCLNGGTCTQTTDGTTPALGVFHCDCLPGYTGDRCEGCPAGFTGDNCDNYVGMCPQSCENGAACMESVYTRCGPLFNELQCNGFWNQNFCNEINGWCGSTQQHIDGSSGTYDYDPLDPDIPSALIGEFTCTCLPGFTGTNCEEDIDECDDPDPCQNGATCTESATNDDVAPNEFNCDCVVGYSGDVCDVDIDECATAPCQNSATCTQGIGEYNCECLPGYIGTNCEEDIDECATAPCQNGAPCIDGIGEYNCECLPGYIGTNCDQECPEDHGAGFYSWNGIDSICEPCPFGEGSEAGSGVCVDINECIVEPCQNSANCKESGSDADVAPGDFECDCVEEFGYTGTLCNECEAGSGRADDGRCKPCEQPQINSVTSHSAPCADQECPENHGASSDSWNGIDSICEPCPVGEESPAGSGVCVDIDECATAPCQNSATCTQGIGEYTCDCPTGYAGTNCEEDIDECATAPCQNSATCTQGIGEYTCDCPTGYAGTNCEEDIDECDPVPCLNSGTCTETSDGVIPAVGVYHCDCQNGYSGGRCQIDTNECSRTDQCQNGATCSESNLDPSIAIGQYRCNCLTGYTGTNCEQGLCDPNPCLYNSTCTQVNGTHICECPPGHAGPHCERNVAIGCDSVPCQHGGTCENLAGDGFVCNCSTGYNGTNCEIECPPGHAGINCDLHTDFGCDAEPCQQGGTCENRAGDGFTCTCSPLFTGKRCEIDANTENTAVNIILICLIIILVIFISVSCGILCCGDASAAVVVESAKKFEKEQLLNTIKIIF